jgi:hypothetical protein
MGHTEKKWMAGLGLGLLAMTGLGAAGVGPLAGLLAGEGAAGAAGAGTAAGAGAAANGVGMGAGVMTPAAAEASAALGTGAGAAGTAGAAGSGATGASLFSGMLKGGATGLATTMAGSAMQPEQTSTQPMGSQLQQQDPNDVFKIIQELKHRNNGMM